MEASITSARKRKGRPKVNATPVNVRVEPALLQALDAFIADQGEVSRPEALRRIVRDWLIGNRYLDSSKK